MPTDLTRLALAGAPLLLGISIGVLAVFLAMREWLARSALPAGRNPLSTLKTICLQYSVASIVCTAVAGRLLGHYLPGHTALHTIQGAMLGLPLGMGAGLRWLLWRGAR